MGVVLSVRTPLTDTVTDAADASRVGAAKAWWLAARPKTLTLAATPVIVGCALAFADLASLSWFTAAATLAAALLIQIGTNLHNDAADFEKGADGPERLGPPRAAAQGWLRTGQIKRGAALSFAIAFALGIYLTLVGGWPILALGLASLAAGYAYTGGPKPIAYSVSGELFVFLFFGLFAVAGTYYLQTGSVSPWSLAAGAALGMPAAAVLLVNNYRDLDNDRKAGKLTLCHHLGRAQSRRLFTLFLTAPFLLVAVDPAIWPLLLALPPAVLLIRRFGRVPPGKALNGVLAATARQQFLFGGLLSVAVQF